jgi:hypothetical protein
MASGLPPVFGPDGLQQRVSFGTNLASEEELSTGVSYPTGPLRDVPFAEGGGVRSRPS